MWYVIIHIEAGSFITVKPANTIPPSLVLDLETGVTKTPNRSKYSNGVPFFWVWLKMLDPRDWTLTYIYIYLDILCIHIYIYTLYIYIYIFIYILYIYIHYIYIFIYILYIYTYCTYIYHHICMYADICIRLYTQWARLWVHSPWIPPGYDVAVVLWRCWRPRRCSAQR